MSENLPVTLAAGGWVLGGIVVLSTVAWVFLFLKLFELLQTGRHIEAQKLHWHDEAGDFIEPIAHLLGASPEVKEGTMDRTLTPLLNAVGVRLERHLGLVAAVAGALPLLGLLGTVIGMVETFEVITVHGTGEPRLMAAGIRKALVTTEAGLVTALPILLLHQYLASKARKIEGELRLLAHRWAQERNGNGTRSLASAGRLS
jgi:biopolymer transport protein ExbB